jgi:hypothetical protein
MQLVADLALGDVSLIEARDTKRFDVLVSAEGPSEAVLSQLDDLLKRARAGFLDRPDGANAAAIIDPDALRRLALPQVDEGWEVEFTTMLAYAQSKGWIEPDGSVRAHLNWSAPGGEGS